MNMISIEHLKTTSHKANAIDKRAINELKWQILSDIKTYHLDEDFGITQESVLNESNYIIVEINGYENIAYVSKDNYVYEKVQPIDRINNKLFPRQGIELQVSYKRY